MRISAAADRAVRAVVEPAVRQGEGPVGALPEPVERPAAEPAARENP
ncbi:hypothetical protein ACFYM3_22395 [Streptomyces massasporeus]|uniref:Uncharacterized protein n=1 Tax=Streptomyces massasporeus TaxID=67324 RepID=A0ABW6LII8_9ACTN